MIQERFLSLVTQHHCPRPSDLTSPRTSWWCFCWSGGCSPDWARPAPPPRHCTVDVLIGEVGLGVTRHVTPAAVELIHRSINVISLPDIAPSASLSIVTADDSLWNFTFFKTHVRWKKGQGNLCWFRGSRVRNHEEWFSEQKNQRASWLQQWSLT